MPRIHRDRAHEPPRVDPPAASSVTHPCRSKELTHGLVSDREPSRTEPLAQIHASSSSTPASYASSCHGRGLCYPRCKQFPSNLKFGFFFLDPSKGYRLCRLPLSICTSTLVVELASAANLLARDPGFESLAPYFLLAFLFVVLTFHLGHILPGHCRVMQFGPCMFWDLTIVSSALHIIGDAMFLKCLYINNRALAGNELYMKND